MKNTVTVVVITLNRPECLRRCMAALQAQTVEPSQVIVVDASHDQRNRSVMRRFPEVLYLAQPELFSRKTASRNRGLLEARGDIVAFLDDNAYAHPDWLQSLLGAYDGPNIGGVGGRALNGQRDEALADGVGVLQPNGFLTGNFASDPGEIIEVDHVIGCNMSFRREVLERLGGFREDFGGLSGLCEDSDLCLRVKALGYRLRFQPEACVDHDDAPQAEGQRLSPSYYYYSRLNSCLMLVRHFGVSPILWRFPLAIAWQSSRELLRGAGGALCRFAASGAGLAAGMVRGFYVYLRDGTDPIRRDAGAEAIRKALRAHAALSATNRPAGR
ncbi:MAG: glycosyltransferase family 2 protein [Chthoniobacteraceae bacterium]